MTNDEPSPFIPNTAIRYAWDSTSLTYLKKCAKAADYFLQQGLTPAIPSTHLTFGIIYHKAIETWRRQVCVGGLGSPAAKDALLRDIVRQVLVESKDLQPLKTKTRESLLRAVLWYIDRWQDTPDALTTLTISDGIPALELSFSWDSGILVDPDGVSLHTFIFCGHFDELASLQGTPYVVDRKTTGSTLSSYYFNQFSPNNQMSFYPFMARKIYGIPARGVIIDAVQVQVTACEFDRVVAHRTPAQLDEWWADTLLVLRQYVTYAKTGQWPMNDTSCTRCDYAPICRLDPSVRRNFLREPAYVHRPWNPLVERTSAAGGALAGTE